MKIIKYNKENKNRETLIEEIDNKLQKLYSKMESFSKKVIECTICKDYIFECSRDKIEEQIETLQEVQNLIRSRTHLYHLEFRFLPQITYTKKEWDTKAKKYRDYEKFTYIGDYSYKQKFYSLLNEIGVMSGEGRIFIK